MTPCLADRARQPASPSGPEDRSEFLLGDARAAGADCLVTVGAAQSDHARTVAAGAAMSGLPCHLVLGGDRPETPPATPCSTRCWARSCTSPE